MKKFLLSISCAILWLGTAAQEKLPVFFGFNMDVPTKSSVADLQDLATANKDILVTGISGFCDSADGNDYNKQLATRRINTVMQILKEAGIAIAHDVSLRPVGEDFPLSPNADENRRVDIDFRRIKSAANVPINTLGLDIRKREEVFEPDADEPSVTTKLGNAKAGDVIRINDINFFLNSEVVVPESEPRMQELYDAMVRNPKLSIEIQGHICCNPNIYDTKLSFRRAKYIFTYLLKKGIPLNRLAYQGFGSSEPIYPIPERTPMEKAANRRVEILIVKN
jgi:outer membrane protein OmpA-like peptidoglycan-associated protein